MLSLIWKARKIIVSSSTGLYNLDDEAEKIYNLTDIKNFVMNGVFVYFVSKIDGWDLIDCSNNGMNSNSIINSSWMKSLELLIISK